MRSHFGPKRNLLDVVSKLQTETDKRAKDEKEDPKLRRKRLYKILSEDKPTFPIQKRNFHSTVTENKEIAKIFGMLSVCIQELRQVS